MTTINRAVILPTNMLSLEVVRSVAGVDAYRVDIDGDTIDVTLDGAAGHDAFSLMDYLPQVAAVTPGDQLNVYVTPLIGGDPAGPASDAVDVDVQHDYSPESILRQMVADAIEQDGLITCHGEVVRVQRNRLGLADASGNLSGRAGNIVEVGISYMASHDPWVNSTDEETAITVPIRVLVKGDRVDRGQVAVDIGWHVRRALTDNLGAMGFGIMKWTWGGSPPADLSGNMVAYEMTITLTRVSLREC